MVLAAAAVQLRDEPVREPVKHFRLSVETEDGQEIAAVQHNGSDLDEAAMEMPGAGEIPTLRFRVRRWESEEDE
jgi:hypothetical protein